MSVTVSSILKTSRRSPQNGYRERLTKNLIEFICQFTSLMTPFDTAALLGSRKEIPPHGKEISDLAKRVHTGG